MIKTESRKLQLFFSLDEERWQNKPQALGQDVATSVQADWIGNA